MRGSWKIARLAGIDVRIHATFLLLLAWVGWSGYREAGELAGAVGGLLLIAMLFALVVLHELGHALAARRCGIATRDITLLPIGGVARLERMPSEPRQQLLVALAGPAVNVLLAVVFAAIAALIGAELVPRGSQSPGLLAQLVYINVALALFNLLPAFPMDGGRALRALLALRLDGLRATQIAAGLGQAIAIVLGVTGLFLSPVLMLVGVFVWFGARAELHAAQLEGTLTGLPVIAAAQRQLQTVADHEALETAVNRTLASFQHDFPVLAGGRVVGLLSYRTMLEALRSHGPEVRISEVMDPAPASVSAREPLSRALSELQASDGRCLLVLGKGDRLAGLLTLEGVGELVAVREAIREGERRRATAQTLRATLTTDHAKVPALTPR